jgi:hypothetical protein
MEYLLDACGKKSLCSKHWQMKAKHLNSQPTHLIILKTLLNKQYHAIKPSELNEIRKTFLDDYITEKLRHGKCCNAFKSNA